MTQEAEPIICHRCSTRVKDWVGDDPNCAFSNKEGLFHSTNWNCATTNTLRSLISNQVDAWGTNFGVSYSDDDVLAIIPLQKVTDELDQDTTTEQYLGDFLLVGWYKQRGETKLLLLVDQDLTRVPNIHEVESILEVLENQK